MSPRPLRSGPMTSDARSRRSADLSRRLVLQHHALRDETLERGEQGHDAIEEVHQGARSAGIRSRVRSARSCSRWATALRVVREPVSQRARDAMGLGEGRAGAAGLWIEHRSEASAPRLPAILRGPAAALPRPAAASARPRLRFDPYARGVDLGGLIQGAPSRWDPRRAPRLRAPRRAVPSRALDVASEYRRKDCSALRLGRSSSSRENSTGARWEAAGDSGLHRSVGEDQCPCSPRRVRAKGRTAPQARHARQRPGITL